MKRFGKILYCSSMSLQLGHFSHTLSTNIAILIFANLFHGTAKYAFWTITLQNNMVALNQNFNRVPLIHLIPFTKGFRQNNSAKLIHFANYTSRLHLTHTFPIQLIHDISIPLIISIQNCRILLIINKFL
ncbi:hypothetical protein PDUR_09465 [Paenibacillus durus]|uniref:Uncharacterized protein n=1 Tax=Paenibacillus durus TaxID=44251 RepID=A0A089HP05_PAEDU|nr:hypothetical protein PDUR_09465 [Paenibacillus durus]